MNKKNIILPIFCVLCCVYMQSINIQDTFAQTSFQEIDRFIEQEIQTWRIPNVSIGITNNDSILYIKEYGSGVGKGSNDTIPVRANYLVGSLSKPFTAIAVMQLVEQGKVKLDEPIKNYLAWFETGNATLSDKITVRHLLNQTSGLPKNAGFFTPTSEQQTAIDNEYKAYLLTLRIDEEAIGKTHIYCNLNYQILGQLIIKVSGLSYADYLNTHIFAPCQMKHTFATYQQTQQYGLRQGAQYLFGFPVVYSFAHNNNGTAAGDIASNAEDMCNFLQMLLNEGKTKNGVVLSAGALQQMQQPFSHRYGMGFSIGDWNGIHSVRHSGLTRNYGAMMNILPNEHYGIVILTNINSFSAARNLMDGVMRRLNNQEKESPPPYEMYLRYGLLALLVWNLLEFILRLNKWRKQGFIAYFSTNSKVIVRLVFGIAFAVIWIIVVPIFADLPMAAMPLMQPDLGYGLIGGAIVGVCSALVQYFLQGAALLVTLQSNTEKKTV